MVLKSLALIYVDNIYWVYYIVNTIFHTYKSFFQTFSLVHYYTILVHTYFFIIDSLLLSITPYHVHIVA